MDVIETAIDVNSEMFIENKVSRLRYLSAGSAIERRNIFARFVHLQPRRIQERDHLGNIGCPFDHKRGSTRVPIQHY